MKIKWISKHINANFEDKERVNSALKTQNERVKNIFESTTLQTTYKIIPEFIFPSKICSRKIYKLVSGSNKKSLIRNSIQRCRLCLVLLPVIIFNHAELFLMYLLAFPESFRSRRR